MVFLIDIVEFEVNTVKVLTSPQSMAKGWVLAPRRQNVGSDPDRIGFGVYSVLRIVLNIARFRIIQRRAHHRVLGLWYSRTEGWSRMKYMIAMWLKISMAWMFSLGLQVREPLKKGR